MENERPKHNFLCLRRSWSRIWGLVSCLETAREKYCLACGPSSPPQHRAVAQHSLGLDSADDCLLDRVLHCRHLSTHHSNYYHLSLLAMLGIGDYGDLFAIIANFNFQLRQLVFLGNRFCLSDDSDHNERLLLGLFLQLLPTFVAKVAVKVEICGLAFLVLASYHLSCRSESSNKSL